MDAARAAVNKITSRTGHKTDVDEYVNPAVVSETIKPHRHVETQEAIDREVHQDHYHTTIQPIAHQERLPEKHIHQLAPQIEREIRHDNEEDTARRVQAELAQFKNTQTIQQTTTSQASVAAVSGEHVHHHVHEVVQPIIHKETIQPEVIHTTVPIHETHIEQSQYHGISALPMKTLDEFKATGGLISGTKSHTHEEYDGAPRPYNDKLRTTLEEVMPGHHGQHGHHHGHNTTGTGIGSTTGTGIGGTSGTGIGSTSGTGIGSNTGTGIGGHHHHSGTGSSNPLSNTSEYDNRRGESGYDNRRGESGIGSGIGSDNYGTRGNDEYGQSGVTRTGTDNFGTTSGHHHDKSSTTGKPSLMDRLNPMKDTDHDGKKGVME